MIESTLIDNEGVGIFHYYKYEITGRGNGLADYLDVGTSI